MLPSKIEKHGSPGLIPFSVAIFLSAFLLFQVQPLISRYILPWFGGTPAVWSTALLFFQTLLFIGYAFAHWFSSWSKRYLIIYLGLLIASGFFLIFTANEWGIPLLPDTRWQPNDPQYPVPKILAILSIGVGLPYFLLATTSPTLQAWFKKFRPTQKPYPLYALSNFGSLLGLISFPFLIEPIFGLTEQSWFWSGFYFIYLGFCVYLGVLFWMKRGQESTQVDLEEVTVPDPKNSLPTTFQKILWMALPACSAILLLAVTNQITQDIASIPFLWVLPLSVYLFSFILAFSGEKWYPQLLLIGALAVATVGVAYRMNVLKSTGMFVQIGTFILFLLIACWVCHGELYRLRPEQSQLTRFYLYLAFGSVIGAVFVNLVAPIIFNGFWELYIGILFCWILVGGLQFAKRPSIIDHRWFGEIFLLVFVVLGLSTYLFVREINTSLDNIVEVQRSFYGVLRVRYVERGNPSEPIYDLKHGSTSHGFQFLNPEKQNVPTSYYGHQSGVGLAITHYRSEIAEGHPLNIGLIGLGPGTLAAYGEIGDHFRFYEINPDVIRLANENAGYFTFLANSPAQNEIVPGDARISLATELKNGQQHNFDLLVLDAFSSDSIPTHLLTMEAMELYQKHLKPDGVIAINISNRYLNLASPIRNLAAYSGLSSALIYNESDDEVGSYASNWMLLSRYSDFFQIPEIMENIVPPAAGDPNLRLWTDDYINLLTLIKKDVFAEIR